MPRPRRPARRAAGRRPGAASLAPGAASGLDAARAPVPFATGYHAPVLAAEVVAGLVTDPAGLYVDGTLGGGGHAAALLDTLGPAALVVGIDRDAEARAEATARLAAHAERGRFRALAGNFADAEALLAAAGLGPAHGRPVAGVLLDLGVSSHQLDAARRGFAFSADGPLDMRMNASAGETAAELLARLDEAGLARVLYIYGEEPRSRRIARSIAERMPVETTAALADAVRAAVPEREQTKALARTFQALRIAVNEEMEALEAALPAAQGLLAPGGRLAVIAYHSLEDRRAKHFLRFGHFGDTPVKDFYGRVVTPWRLVTRKPIVATEAEVAANGRARSARLRIAEKLPGTDASPVPGAPPAA